VDFNIMEYLSGLEPMDLSVRMPPCEYEERIERLRGELRRRRLDAFFGFGHEYRPGDVGWLTGYDPHIESAMVIVGPREILVLGSPDAMR